MGLTTTTATQQQKSMRSTDILLQQESAHFTPRLHHRLRSIAMVFRLSSAHLRTSGRSTSFRPRSLLLLTPMSTQYCKTQHPIERAPKLNLPSRFVFDLSHKLADHEEQIYPLRFDSMRELRRGLDRFWASVVPSLIKLPYGSCLYANFFTSLRLVHRP